MFNEFGGGVDSGDDCAFGFEDSGVSAFAAAEIENRFVVEIGEDCIESGVKDRAARPVPRLALVGDPGLGGGSPFFERRFGHLIHEWRIIDSRRYWRFRCCVG